jgi:ATP-dependent DNA helicase RecG
MAQDFAKIVLMNLDQIKALVAQGESHHLEFKKSTGLLTAAFETVCAFLNSDGGTVLIGVTNEGRIVGQELTDKIQQTISNEISKLEPPAKIEVAYLPLEMPLPMPSEAAKRFIILLQVKPVSHKPYVYEGRPFQREQTVTKRMPQQRYDQLVSERLQLNFSWERMAAIGYSVKDLDYDLLQGVVRKAVETKRMPEEALHQDIPKLLEALDLIKDGSINNAAVVLFGKKMVANYHHCQLQLARFQGLDRSEFMDIDLAYGNVFELMEKAMVFVRRHLPIAAKIIPDQMERVETPLIPFNAIREVLYNAFCHRDYTIYGGSIGLAIYDDRMEIFSHGSLPPGATLEKIKEGFSKRRNPVIADVFYRTNLIEKWGRGIQKIISLCLVANVPEPEFFADALEVKVTFRFPTSLKPPVFEAFEMRIPKAPDGFLTQREQLIIDTLTQEGELSAKDILTHIKPPVSLRTLNYDLSSLKDKGLIDMRGETNNRIWILTKN